MEQASSVSSQVVEDGDHAGLGVGQLGPGGVPVLDEPADAFEGAGAVRDHPGGVGQGGIEACAGSAGRAGSSRGG